MLLDYADQLAGVNVFAFGSVHGFLPQGKEEGLISLHWFLYSEHLIDIIVTVATFPGAIGEQHGGHVLGHRHLVLLVSQDGIPGKPEMNGLPDGVCHAVVLLLKLLGNKHLFLDPIADHVFNNLDLHLHVLAIVIPDFGDKSGLCRVYLKDALKGCNYPQTRLFRNLAISLYLNT